MTLLTIAPSECPATHPFAFDNGDSCCKFYKRNSEGSCDGTALLLEDPETCCSDYVPCDSQFDLGCKDHFRAYSKEAL